MVVAIAVASGGWLLFEFYRLALPDVEHLANYQPPVATRVLAADGTQVGEFFIEKRYVVPIYRIPRVVQLAFIAAEDASFYEHKGFDLASIARAAISNYSAGATRQGGSTITQQVIKQLILTPERSYERKLKEVLLATKLEAELTKDQILELYLNQIYLGDGAYGIEAAAHEYFGKDAAELDLAEASLLAGLPQAPARYSPTRHFKRARARQDYVLRRMVEEGFVTQAQAQQALARPMKIEKRRLDDVGPAPYYVEYIRRLLVKRYGSTATYQLGLVVETPLDLSLQLASDRAVQEGVMALDERQGFRGPLGRVTDAQLKGLLAAPAAATNLPAPGTILDVVVVPDERGRTPSVDGSLVVRWAGGAARFDPKGWEWARKRRYTPAPGDRLEASVGERAGSTVLELTHRTGAQGAMIAMDPQTGDVRALVGGLDFAGSEFDRATQALRQPGSAFKPLLYAAAMERGFSPSTVVVDGPVSYNVGVGQPRWSPKNFDHRYRGPVTLREALTRSLNVVTVKLVNAMGLRFAIDYLPRFGFERPFPKNLSISLGTAEVTLLEMVRAFSVFPAGGNRVEPRFLTRITDRQGRTVEDEPPVIEPAIDPATAYVMVGLLRNVIEKGTGRGAAIGRPAGGKTGTTNDQHDAWFIGFTPELTVGIWVGYDFERSLASMETGGRAAAPIWKAIMEEALAGIPVRDFPMPADVVLVPVDSKSGLRSKPGSGDTVLEAFPRGREPRAIEEAGTVAPNALVNPGGASPDTESPPSAAAESSPWLVPQPREPNSQALHEESF